MHYKEDNSFNLDIVCFTLIFDRQNYTFWFKKLYFIQKTSFVILYPEMMRDTFEAC